MSKPKHILCLAPQPFFSPRGTPFSVYYRTLVTTELGHSVDILTYGQGSDVELPNVKIFRTPSLAWFGKIRTGPSILKIFHDLMLVFYFIGMQVRYRYKIIHAHEEAVFFAALFKPIFGYRLIYDMHSSLPEQLTNFNFTKSRWLIALFEKLEKFSLNQADAVITICPALRDQVASMMPTSMDKHQLIENSIFDPVRLKNNNADFDVDDVPPTIARGSEQKMIVYAGTLESYQGIEILIGAIAKLSSQRQDFVMVIAGGTTEQVQHYQGLSRSLGADSATRFLGQISPNAARSLNKGADIIVSPRSTGNNTPLKIYEQLACGVPLVATAIYSHTQVLDSSMCMLVKPTPEDFCAALEQLLDDDALCARLTEQAMQHYDSHYAKPIYTKKLNTILSLVS